MSRIANRGEAFEPGSGVSPPVGLLLPQLERWRQAFDEYKRSRSLLDYDDCWS